MDDLISRAAALNVINTWGRQKSEKVRMGLLHRDLEMLPAINAIPVEWLECKRKEALREGMRPDEVEAVEMVLWMWQKEQETRNESKV